MIMILQNFRPLQEERCYSADLFDPISQKTIPVIIQKGGGYCDWVAIDKNNDKNMWELFHDNPNANSWNNGDKVALGRAIH